MRLLETLNMLWNGDIIENLRTGYIVIRKVTKEGAIFVVTSAGFLSCHIDGMEKDINELAGTEELNIMILNLLNTIGGNYIFVKPIFEDDGWGFRLDKYCEEKNRITDIISRLNTQNF